MNKFKSMGLAALAVMSVGVANSFAVPVFELPLADVTQVKGDFTLAAQVIIGIALTVLGYKLIRRLVK